MCRLPQVAPEASALQRVPDRGDDARLVERLLDEVDRAEAHALDRVLDPERMGTARTLDVHMSRLRKKLGVESKRIATVWGIGYRFDPSEDA